MKIFSGIFSFIKKHKILTGIFIIIAGVVIFILRPKPEPVVPTQTVSRSHFVQSVSTSGTVQAKNFANLSFLTGGKLVYLGVKKGDMVKQYQTIATLDQRTLQKNLEAALITYSEQRNTFDQTRDTNQNRTPQEALNDAMKRILENNQYDLNKAINSVELQSLAQEQSVLIAPISGLVTRADAKTIGVNVDATTTFSIVDPNTMVFDMDVDEADVGKISVGQKAELVLDAFSDVTIYEPITSIDFVSHTTSTGGTAYTAEINLPDNKDERYKIGMNGNADIIVAEKDSVISVPINALVDNQYVYVQISPNVFEKRRVYVGLQNDTNAEITKGLQSGEKIALDTTAAEKHVKK